MKAWKLAAVVFGLAGCTGGTGTDGGDAARDAATSDAAIDGTASGDAASDAIQSVDAADVQGVDTAGMDVVGTPDTGGGDGGNPADTGGGTDVVVASDGCSGTLTVSVTAPASGAMIDTCTRAGMAVYYDFTATTTGTGVASVTFNWRNPDGDLVSPTTPITSGPPFVARRQVGGLAVPGAPPSLAVAGGRNAIGGTWQLEVAARDACGRVANATRPFVLTFTRGDTCPNP